MKRSFPSYLYLIMYVVAQSVAIAQQTPSFGLVGDVKSIRKARGLLTGDFNGDGIADIASYNDMGLDIQFQIKDSLGFHESMSNLKTPIAQIRAANLNGDKITDLVVLSDTPPELHVFIGKQNGTFTERWGKALRGKELRFTLGDPNNDGKTDILVYGKKEPGVMVYAGAGNGTFRGPQELLPDVAFTGVAINDYNDDNMNDLIGINWISNEVELFLAYGRMKFGNPSALPFENEPAFILPVALDSARTPGVVVGFSEENGLHIYNGNGFGGFVSSQVLALGGLPNQVAAADVNHDGKPDLIILSQEERSVDVWLNNGNGLFENHIEFAAGKNPTKFTVFNDRHPGNVNLAILDSSASRIRILYNAEEPPAGADEIDYCTGLAPAGVAAADVNHDGNVDLLVANSGSQNYSLYLNDGKGGLRGQLAFPVAMNPTDIFCSPKDDSTATVLLTGTYEEKILLNDVNLNSFLPSVYSIPSQPDPSFLGLVKSPKAELFDMFALEYDRSTQKRSLTKFEQTAPRRFVEKNLTPALPVISAALSAGKQGDGSTLYTMTYDTQRKQITVSRADAEDARRTATPAPVFTLSADTKPNGHLWVGDVNSDGIDDLLINLREPDNSLIIALGHTDQTFGPPQPIQTDEISIAERSQLKIADLNGDGIPDLVIQNNLDRSIQAYMGRGGGAFMPKMRITSSIGFGGFEVVTLKKDVLPFLILVDNAQGLLKIIRMNE